MYKSIIIFILIFSNGLFAQEQSLESLKQQEELENALDIIKKLEVEMDIATKNRALACTKAIGYEPFCSCIMKKLPVAWTFEQYIFITTKSKKENGYFKMPDDYKLAYDAVSKVRDECVTEINKKP